MGTDKVYFIPNKIILQLLNTTCIMTTIFKQGTKKKWQQLQEMILQTDCVNALV